MRTPIDVDDETELLTLARMWKATATTEASKGRGALAAALRAQGIRFEEHTEAMALYLFWAGVEYGLRAAFEPAVVDALREMGSSLPGVANR